VIISFVLASGLTLIVSIIVHFLRGKDYEQRYAPPDPILEIGVLPRLPREPYDPPEAPRERWVRILESLVLNLSDQLLATSFAILVTAFIRHCQISNYHLNIVCDLAWFSTITHLLSVGVLRVYFRRKGKTLILYADILDVDCNGHALVRLDLVTTI
jgi:hypothetical protein